MKRQNDCATPVLPGFDPLVFVPVTRIRQADGSILIKPGVPVILRADDEISTAEAARIMGCATDWVGKLCDRGAFIEGADWRRNGPNGNYKLKRASVLRYAGIPIPEGG